MSQSTSPDSARFVNTTATEQANVETISGAIQTSQEAFQRDLPKLLTTHPMQWVAYCGIKRIGIGPSKSDLYRHCLDQGHKRGEFVVRSIEPLVSEDVDALSEV